MKRLRWLVAGLLLLAGAAPLMSAKVTESQMAQVAGFTPGDIKGFAPATEVKLSKFGGWMARKFQPTGFFHTTRQDGRWWLVDPEGWLFLCIGVNSVNFPAAIAASESQPPSPEQLKWAGQALTRLRQHHFNMVGCWSSTDAIRQLAQPMPYCLRWNFMAGYRQQRKKKYPATGTIEAIYPFDPEFETYCEGIARGMEATRTDPFLLGHFSDNELPLHEDGIVARYLQYPANDPCHQAAARFMATRPGVSGKSADRAFLELVVREYYRKVAAAIKKHDPNHMFIGSRFHGKALASPALFTGAGPYADVISVNYYNRLTPENDRIQTWARLAGKPILITEWYAMGEDAGLANDKGAGFIVRSQADRARFYQHFTLTLLQNPACVGWHWFKYRDGATNNCGIVNARDEPYTGLLQAMEVLNAQVYPLAGHFWPGH